MPKPPIERHWQEAVKWLVESPPEGKHLTDKEIATHLEELGRQLGVKRYPSARSVTRIRQSFPDDERGEYRRLYWPESMEGGSLPWEASASSMELLQSFKNRPPIRLARWFWRVTLAVPDAPFNTRQVVAGFLAAAEVAGVHNAGLYRGIENLLSGRGKPHAILDLQTADPGTLREALVSLLDTSEDFEEFQRFYRIFSEGGSAVSLADSLDGAVFATLPTVADKAERDEEEERE